MPSGYPPPDKGLRRWLLLLDLGDQKETAERLRGFLHSLLRVTLEKLKLIERSVIVYDHSDQNLTAVQIPQGRRTFLVDRNSTHPKFKSDSVNWRFAFAVA